MEFLRRDGVSLGYRLVKGKGDPIVLVHGWCCDHTFMEPQFEHFVASGRTVLALDLRGHGDSDKPVQDYPMSGFSDDIVWMVRELGLEKPVIVGHSMGGVIAFDIAMRYPDFPAAIVVLDSSIALTATARAGMSAFIEALAGPQYKAAVEEYAARVLFVETDDAERRRRLLASMVSAPQHMMVAAFTGLRDFDPAGAEQRIVAPSLYIAADEPQPRSDLARLHDLIPHLHYGRVVGSGHFCQLEVPDQVNAMIDRFVKVASIGLAR